KAEAKKMLAEAFTAEKAAPGLAEARVMRAKNELIEKKGAAEAKVLSMKFGAEAEGIENKANAMKLLDAVGREHEEFKLELDVEKAVKLAHIDNSKKVARYHSQILGEALKTAKVDIVGGETEFFDRIVNAVSAGKSFDRWVDSSDALTNVKETFFNSDPDYFEKQLRKFFKRFGVSAGDVKDLTISAALARMASMSEDPEQLSSLYSLISMAKRTGLGEKPADALDLFTKSKAAGKA
ncbi:MAG: flotillin family protein, partial [Desulfobacterales bacterium]|nr:flotillin family protein [Desulfobacterales bacterium]